MGPVFNGTRLPSVTACRYRQRECDDGGAGRLSRRMVKFTALHGGTLYHLFSTPPHTCQVTIPASERDWAACADSGVWRWAGGAIPDAAILALEDPNDRDGDGIRGRAARVTDVVSGRERIGRFGWKSQHATLLAFSGDAYRNEMGNTNDLFPDETALGIDPEQLKLCSPTRGIEDVRDRRTRMRGIDNFANFMKFLAPVARGALNDSVRSGEALFRAIGCATCHVPSLATGADSNPLFDRKAVPLFSDLLLHDVGTGDGIEQDAAGAAEIRTPALWGLRLRRPLLHDGSAATPAEAIERHGGEAAGVVAKFRDLSAADRQRLLDFLGSL